ncbi:hypothetical protein [Colwellia sp. BRX10-4]|uniref:hypothetical protein n=1 Tax=Colwellia sp. BRX10-4 TaxID=2759843 RepID=UPI0015F47168|nr:hypothetical protein [Colwellia sp. BRX10-4]MBA6399884.1 hypothetical protein [Colwellia sp. BRX10-4]
MFKSGFRKLHVYMSILSIAAICLWLSIFTFVFGVIFDVNKIQVQPIFVIPFTIWFFSALITFSLAAFVKCQSCNKRLVVITKSNVKSKNKGWVFWFLRELPPKIKCEHCGVLYTGTPNKPLK